MKTIAQQLNIKKFPFEIKDDDGNQIYFENSTGIWIKRERDSNGKEIYFEDSYGYIEDNRPKQTIEVTLKDVAKAMNIDVKQLRIKE